VLRQAITTVAPRFANTSVAAFPRPLFAPVTTTVRSDRSGTSVLLQPRIVAG